MDFDPWTRRRHVNYDKKPKFRGSVALKRGCAINFEPWTHGRHVNYDKKPSSPGYIATKRRVFIEIWTLDT